MDDSQNEYDSLKDIVEFQNNQFNPGYYIGTGKVPPMMGWSVGAYMEALYLKEQGKGFL